MFPFIHPNNINKLFRTSRVNSFVILKKWIGLWRRDSELESWDSNLVSDELRE